MKRPIIISGELNSRKTSMLYSLCSLLDSQGSRLGGVIQVAQLPHKPKTSYTLSDQGTGNCRLLMQEQYKDSFEQVGRFWVDFSTFQWAYEITMAQIETADYITVDEMGPIELGGRGFDQLVRTLIEHYKGTLILVCRSSLVEQLISYYTFDKEEIIFLESQKEWESQFKRVLG
jgi:nucleoside-triphosphatase THEP1